MRRIFKQIFSLKNLILFICFFSIPVYGNSNSGLSPNKIDQSVKDRIIQLHQKALLSLDTQPEQAFYYVSQAILLGRSLNDNELLAKEYSILGKYYKEIGKTDSAVSYLQKAVDTYNSIGDTINACYSLNDLALVFKIRAEFRKGIALLESVLRLDPCLKDQSLQGLTCENIGKLHYSLGEYDKSSDYEFRALQLSEQVNDTTAMARACNNIGNVFGAMSNVSQSVIYYKKAIALNKATKNNELLSCNLNNIGNMFCGRENYDSALFYFQTAIDVLGNSNNKIWLAIYYNNMGDVLSKMHNYKKSIFNYEKARDLFEYTGDVKGISLIYREIGELYFEKGDYQLAINYAQKAFEIANEIGAKDYVISTYSLLAKANAGLNRYKEAYEYHVNYKDMSDSVLGEKSQRQLQELGYKYDTEKKEKELEIQGLQIQYQTADLKKKRTLIVIILIGFLLTVGLLISVTINFYRQKHDHEALFQRNMELLKIEKQQDATVQKNDEVLLPKKGFKDEDRNQKTRQFELLMNQRKLYRNPNLNLQMVADELDTNRVYLSQLINECYNKHFNNLINEYRIKEARRILLDTQYDEFSIEGIAQMVGFNSKSVFNESFKKITGLTPSSYKKMAHQIIPDEN